MFYILRTKKSDVKFCLLFEDVSPEKCSRSHIGGANTAAIVSRSCHIEESTDVVQLSAKYSVRISTRTPAILMKVS
jgi:hypothetical protein